MYCDASIDKRERKSPLNPPLGRPCPERSAIERLAAFKIDASILQAASWLGINFWSREDLRRFICARIGFLAQRVLQAHPRAVGFTSLAYVLHEDR